MVQAKQTESAEEARFQDEPVSQKPVAYDADGKPLYAAPTEAATSKTQPGPQIVHMARALEPVDVEVTPEVKQRHEESMRRYPWLNLSEHEYIISAVRRHPVGMWGTAVVTTILLALVFIVISSYDTIGEMTGQGELIYGPLLLGAVLFGALALIGGYLAIWVYQNNRFFLTNESVIQEIQTTVFSKREQTVSLMNIEDASFSQHGPLQTFLNYGSIRLSTEGEETTYRFDYVHNPKHQIAILNNAVEAFKNGRPVGAPDDN